MSAKLCGEATALAHPGRKAGSSSKSTWLALISQHNAQQRIAPLVAKERSDAFADIPGARSFPRHANHHGTRPVQRKAFQSTPGFILDDQELLVELIGSADLEVIKDLTRGFCSSHPCFDDMDKRSLSLGSSKSYPAVPSLISANILNRSPTWWSPGIAWSAAKTNTKKLVHKKIPANSKEIAIARSYGDLRGEPMNHKAAKKRCTNFSCAGRVRLENLLVRARGTDFANPKTDQVGIGTVVRVTGLNGPQHEETYSILGAWIFDADKLHHQLSQVPWPRHWMAHKPGEAVEFDMDGVKKHYRS